MRGKIFSSILVGLISGLLIAVGSFLWLDRHYIQQRAVMTLVQTSMDNPAIQDLLAAQVLRYLKSPEGSQEMLEYLKRPEVAKVLAEHLESPEVRPQLVQLFNQPDVRRAFIASLAKEPEFKILQALSEFAEDTNQGQGSSQ